MSNPDYVEGGEEPELIPYSELTMHEFDILYNKNAGGLWESIENTALKFKVVEIPRMFDRLGERSLMYLFGAGYTTPDYTISPCSEDYTEIIQQVQQ
jgi:hypothetical protein